MKKIARSVKSDETDEAGGADGPTHARTWIPAKNLTRAACDMST